MLMPSAKAGYVSGGQRIITQSGISPSEPWGNKTPHSNYVIRRAEIPWPGASGQRGALSVLPCTAGKGLSSDEAGGCGTGERAGDRQRLHMGLGLLLATQAVFADERKVTAPLFNKTLIHGKLSPKYHRKEN